MALCCSVILLLVPAVLKHELEQHVVANTLNVKPTSNKTPCETAAELSASNELLKFSSSALIQ